MIRSDFRMTRQREFILQELRESKTHPTADEIYLSVRDRLPKISLGTVYRNLEILSEMGAITKLEGCGSQRRYDGNVGNHYHIRCQRCGRVDDLPENSAVGVSYDSDKIPGYTVIGHSVVLSGICSACRNL